MASEPTSNPTAGRRSVALEAAAGILVAASLVGGVLSLAGSRSLPRTTAAVVAALAAGAYLLLRALPGRSPAIDLAGDAQQRLASDHRHRVQSVLNAARTMRIVFQPIVDVATGVCVGYEALTRFEGGRPANEWFAEAHALGLGVELEMAAIERALAQYSSDAYLSINLSPATLTSPAFVAFLEAAARPGRIVAELTEHAVVEDYDEVRSALEAVRRLGARIAVDDAGSGISSMRHILSIAPEIIKLDRSLISRIDDDVARQALATSLVQFATGIGAHIVAEGIERREELDACRDAGIPFAQGYLIGVPGPMPAAACVQALDLTGE